MSSIPILISFFIGLYSATDDKTVGGTNVPDVKRTLLILVAIVGLLVLIFIGFIAIYCFFCAPSRRSPSLRRNRTQSVHLSTMPDGSDGDSPTKARKKTEFDAEGNRIEYSSTVPFDISDKTTLTDKPDKSLALNKGRPPTKRR